MNPFTSDAIIAQQQRWIGHRCFNFKTNALLAAGMPAGHEATVFDVHQ